MISLIEERVLAAIEKALASGASRVSAGRVAADTGFGMAAVRNAFRELRDQGYFRRVTELDRFAYPSFVHELA